MSLFDSWFRAWLDTSSTERWAQLETELRDQLRTAPPDDRFWRRIRELDPGRMEQWDEAIRFPSGVLPSEPETLFEVRLSHIDEIKRASALGDLPFRPTVVGFEDGVIDASLTDAISALLDRWPECLNALDSHMRFTNIAIDEDELLEVSHLLGRYRPTSMSFDGVISARGEESFVAYLLNVPDHSQLSHVSARRAFLTVGAIEHLLDTVPTLTSIELRDCGLDYDQLTRVVDAITEQMVDVRLHSGFLTATRCAELEELLTKKGLEIPHVVFSDGEASDDETGDERPSSAHESTVARPPRRCKTLRVSHPPCTDPMELARMLRSPEIITFEHLHLANAFLSHGTWEPVLDAIGELTSLRALTLEGVPLGELFTTFWEDARLENLEALELDSVELTSRGLIALARNEHLGSLERLIFSNVSIDEPAARALARATWPELAVLELEGARFSGRAFEILMSGEGLETLSELRIRDSEIEDRGLCAIADSQLPEQLKILVLDKVGATAAGVRVLARSHGFELLTELTLSRNDIGAYGLRVLLESSGLSALQFLNITGCSIEKLSTECAFGDTFPALRELFLAENAISPGDMAKLFHAPLDALESVSVDTEHSEFIAHAIARMISQSVQPGTVRSVFLNGVRYELHQLTTFSSARVRVLVSARSVAPPRQPQPLIDVDEWLSRWDAEPSEAAWRAIMKGLEGGALPLVDVARIKAYTTRLMHKWPAELRVLSNQTLENNFASSNAAKLPHLFTVLEIKGTSAMARYISHFKETSCDLTRASLTLRLGRSGEQQQDARKLLERTANVLDELTLTGATFSALSRLSLPMPRLKRLRLITSRNVTRAQFHEILANLDTPALQQLTLHVCNVGDDGIRGLEESAERLTKLETLQVDACDLTEVGASIIARTIEKLFLTELSLNENWIGDAGVKALSSSSGLNMLKKLELTNCALSDEGAKIIAKDHLLSDLEALDLSANNLGEEAARALGASKTLARVEVLGLASTQLAAKGVETLMSGYGMKSLSTLWLSDNHLGHDAMTAIASAPRFSRIRELDLSKNPIDYSAALLLVRAAGDRLRRVSLRETRVTTEELDELIFNAPESVEEISIA